MRGLVATSQQRKRRLANTLQGLCAWIAARRRGQCQPVVTAQFEGLRKVPSRRYAAHRREYLRELLQPWARVRQGLQCEGYAGGQASRLTPATTAVPARRECAVPTASASGRHDRIACYGAARCPEDLAVRACEAHGIPAHAGATMGLAELWAVEDHVCRVCFGRIISARGDENHTRGYLCTNCGAKSSGRAVSCVCCCGLRLRPGVDAMVRCQRNENPTPEFPSEIIAAQLVPQTTQSPVAEKYTQKKTRRIKNDDVYSGNVFDEED